MTEKQMSSLKQSSEAPVPPEDESPSGGPGNPTSAEAPHRLPLFPLGRVVATPGALDFLQRHAINPADLLERHQCGDWGDVCAEDAQENELSVEKGFRLLSAYSFGPAQEKIWLITEADRSASTLLLPSEY